MIKKNEGDVDRIIRFILGVIFLVVGIFFTKSELSVILIILGFILIITAITGFCGLYKILGINTLPKK